MNGEGWLNYKEAADLVGLSEYTLRRFVSEGKIQAKRVGMKRRFVSIQLEYRTNVRDSGNFNTMKHSCSWEGKAPAGCRA